MSDFKSDACGVNVAVLGLGCNIPHHGIEQIERMVTELNKLGDVWTMSEIYRTLPYGASPECKVYYTNAVIALSTSLSLDTLLAKTKEIESIMGRFENQKFVMADIDIVIWNGTVLREKEIDRDYFAIGFNEIKQNVGCLA